MRSESDVPFTAKLIVTWKMVAPVSCVARDSGKFVRGVGPVRRRWTSWLPTIAAASRRKASVSKGVWGGRLWRWGSIACEVRPSPMGPLNWKIHRPKGLHSESEREPVLLTNPGGQSLQPSPSHERYCWQRQAWQAPSASSESRHRQENLTRTSDAQRRLTRAGYVRKDMCLFDMGQTCE